MYKFFKSALAVAGLGLLATWSFSASAAVVTCGDFQLGDALACEAGSDNNDPYPFDLTAFGVDWVSIDKDDTADDTSGNDGDTGNPEEWFHWTAAADQDPADVRAGDWFVDSAVWDAYDRLVIVLKASDEFVAFEIEPEDLSGIWASIAHGLSHASLYGIAGTNGVAEPGTLALLGLGLIAIGSIRRRSGRRV